MEKMGVPAIPMCTQAYTELAKLTAARDGMPHLRQVFTPHPVGGKTDAELAAYLVNPDPVSGIQIMKEIVDRPDHAAYRGRERRPGCKQCAAGPATYGPDTVDNLQEIFMNNGMTDYMPIIIPTEEKVEAMLKGDEPQAGRSAQESDPGCGLYVRAVGVHGEAGGRERGDGGMQAGIFSGGAGHGVRGATGAFRLHDVSRAPRS